MGSHSLLQGIFLTQGLNPHLLHSLVGSLPLAPQAALIVIYTVIKDKAKIVFTSMEEKENEKIILSSKEIKYIKIC